MGGIQDIMGRKYVKWDEIMGDNGEYMTLEKK